MKLFEYASITLWCWLAFEKNNIKTVLSIGSYSSGKYDPISSPLHLTETQTENYENRNLTEKY